MRVRLVRSSDRDEYLRMLLLMYPELPESAHIPSMDAFFAGEPHESLLPSAVFVAEREGSGLCGFLELSVRNYAEDCAGWTPYVETWYVDDDSRRHGVGRALMAAAEEWSRTMGHREIASDALLTNERSHRAHASCGFTETERVVHFRKDL